MGIGNWRGMFPILTIYGDFFIRINYSPENPGTSGKKLEVRTTK
jgi:hypothetical protein